MQEFKPTLTSGSRYRGFKLEDRHLIFTKNVLDVVLPLNPVSIWFDRGKGIVRIKRGGEIYLPKNGRYNKNMEEMKMPRGRYHLINIKDDWIDFQTYSGMTHENTSLTGVE